MNNVTRLNDDIIYRYEAFEAWLPRGQNMSFETGVMAWRAFLVGWKARGMYEPTIHNECDEIIVRPIVKNTCTGRKLDLD